MAKKEHMQGKSDRELETLIVDSQKALYETRVASAGARPKDADAPKKLRKVIARAKTEQRARVRTALLKAPATP